MDCWQSYLHLSAQGRPATETRLNRLRACRRKWKEALDDGDVRAAIIVQVIAKLYRIEEEATVAGLDPEARLALRLDKCKPLVHEIGEWVPKIYAQAPPKTPLGKAVGYTLNQWRQLNRFLEDGRIELDNTGAERALRAVAVGRKNFLFAGSDQGARTAAVYYSIFGTCALIGLDPWEYTRNVFVELSRGFPQSRIRERPVRRPSSSPHTSSHRSLPASQSSNHAASVSL